MIRTYSKNLYYQICAVIEFEIMFWQIVGCPKSPVLLRILYANQHASAAQATTWQTQKQPNQMWQLPSSSSCQLYRIYCSKRRYNFYKSQTRTYTTSNVKHNIFCDQITNNKLAEHCINFNELINVKTSCFFWWWNEAHADYPGTAVMFQHFFPNQSLTSGHICYVKLHHATV